MAALSYSYNGKSWRPSATVGDKDSFFHSAFGVRTNERGAYFDKHAKARRLRWTAFLTHYQNEPMPITLANVLKKCLTATEEYKVVSVEDKELFENYISDILEKDVIVQEIPVLSTLENVKIVLFPNGDSNPVLIAEPNPEILGDYQNEKPKKEVVLCVRGNTFSKMEPVDENSIVKSNKNIGEMVKHKITDVFLKQSGSCLQRYKKRGSAGSKSVEFQINLLIVLLFNSLRKLKVWKLSTENEEAGKFDDAVLEWPEGTVLVQAKHRENKTNKVNFNALISTNTNNDNFSLPKYFLSYQEIKHKFKSTKNVVICTNASVHEDILEFLDPVRINPESMLYCIDNDYSFFKFKENILPSLRENVKIYLEKNSQKKNIDQTVITDENLMEFVDRVQFYANYPLERNIGKITEQLLSLVKCQQTSFSEVYAKVTDWFKRKSGIYLTEFVANEMFSQIKRDKHWLRLNEHKMLFKEKAIKLQDKMNIYHFTAERGHLLRELKIYHTLKGNKFEVLYVGTDDGIDEKKRVTDAFQLRYYKFLIIIGSTVAKMSVINEISDKLRGILDEHTDKKIILVTEPDDKLAQQMGAGRSDFVNITGSVTYEELSADSQKKILKRNVFFQGRDVSLRELLVKQTDEEYKTLNSKMLENLIQGERIQVGSEVPPLEQHINRYYISRKFERLIENENAEGETRKETISEDKIFEVTEKLVFIADSPGKGKSTVFSKLALIIKEKYPHLWVFKIELNEYCGILKKFKDMNKKTISIIELLGHIYKTKLSNQLEEVIFLMKGRVVLLLDGVDEISPDYTELVFSLIGQCQEEDNFAKVFISTRPYISEKLEAEFHLRAFTLVPFTTENQISFLTDYWSQTIKLPCFEKRRCEQYAKILLKATSRWVKLYRPEENRFAAIPLQVRMLAEIFQEINRSEKSSDWEGCMEYLRGNEPMPKLPEKINITKIYKMFIDKKRDIFISKENPSGNMGAKSSLNYQFQQYLCYHHTLALKTILRASECQLFSHYQKEDNKDESISKIGIVQVSENDPQFVHRTFAEYFVGESLVMELQYQLQNQNDGFQKFFFDEILLNDKFGGVRAFFDNSLQDVVDSLPSDIFKTYQSLVYDVDSEASSNLIHKLAKEGCLAILRLILKCINCQHFITDEKLKISGNNFNISGRISDNVLNILKSLLQNTGINILDRYNRTPLYYAAERGHSEMMKFLVEEGANVNTRNLFCSALNGAVRGNHFDVVKFLVEQGADIKLMGYKILHNSIITNRLNIAEYLLDRILEVRGLEVKYSIISYTPAYLGRIDLLKYIKEKCLNVNGVIENGYPLIFGAVLGGQVDAIKYLVQQGIDINSRDKDGNTALHLTARRSTLLSVAKTLVELGINVSIKNIFGDTPLHCSVEILDMVELLVENGADVNVGNAKGITAIWIAALISQLESVKFLVQHGSDINVTDNYGNTILHSARGATIRYLVECGVNVHIRNRKGHSPLRTAVENAELDTIRSLILCGVDVNAKDNQENTALHLAAKSPRYQRHMLECLVELGSEINVFNKDGYTPLHIASIEGNLDAVKCLVQLGVDVALKDKKACTSLHAAALNGRWDAVQFLMERDTIIDIDENSRKMVLNLANKYRENVFYHGEFGVFHESARCGDLDMVKLFVEFGVNINITDKYGCTPLHYAVLSCQRDVIKYFWKRRLNFSITDEEGYTVLYYAISSGQWDMVQFLLNRRINTNAKDRRGRTALHYAVQAGEWKMVKNFLERGMDVNSKDDDGCTAIHLAASRCNLEFVKRLLKKGADASIKDKRGRTVLHYAVHAGEWKIAKIFLKRGMDVNSKDDDGCTPIHLAASRCNLEFIKRLLQRGADASIRDKRGRTVLHFAVRDSQLDVTEHFLDFGIKNIIKDTDGQTALHLAVWKNQLELVKIHVGRGADVNDKDNEGRKPIHLAAKKGNRDMVEFLLKFDCDVNVRDNRGRTPLHFAVLSENIDTVKKFVELGGDINIVDNDGYRPLHLAASLVGNTWSNLSWHAVKLLVQQGADIHSRTSEGHTAAALAEKSGNHHLLDLLEPRTIKKTVSLVSQS